MASERAVAMITDPPYLTNYRADNHPQSFANRPETKDKHWDDYIDYESSVAFYADFLLRGATGGDRGAACPGRVPVVSMRSCASRLARAEKVAAVRYSLESDAPTIVIVEVDGAGTCRIGSVCGPSQGCPSQGWPTEAFEPFCGEKADLDAYYARHGWQPQRTIFLCPENPGESRFGARRERPDESA